MGKKYNYRSMITYKIKFDHLVDGIYITHRGNEEVAMKYIKKKLEKYPHIKASLQISKKRGLGWKAHSSYEMRRNRKTGRMRLVKL